MVQYLEVIIFTYFYSGSGPIHQLIIIHIPEVSRFYEILGQRTILAVARAGLTTRRTKTPESFSDGALVNKRASDLQKEQGGMGN